MTPAWICAAIALSGLAMVCANLGVFPALTPARDNERDVVVACVAMRNEARRAARCIASLLAQPEIAAVVVCDDGSTDGTADIADRLARAGSRVHVVRASGSKRVALAAAAAYAGRFACPYLFFTDADVELDSGAIGSLIRYAHSSGAAAVTAWPRLTNGSWCDKLLTPAIALLLMHALPMRLTRAGNRKITAGNGQLFLVETAAYAAAGGHAAVDSPVEDVALAQNLTRAGFPPALASASRIAGAEGYASPQETVCGLGRSLYYGGGAVACIAFAAWQIAAFVLPFALLALEPRPAAIALCASALSRWIVAARMREPLLFALPVPLGALASAAAACAAAIFGLRGSLTWRGRPLNA
ncbi:MAG TPA: glycosyltransferase family 2 protein [Candidatus Baltobacteraceae bacterium]|nr:glycosyltransferase family 2 protein [Candidatus Baltobacteraceae bacterium]